jgi:two-component system sensor histidine kinase PilS (NtrC family)
MSPTRMQEASGSYATFWRSLQTLCVTRVVIALVLLLYISFSDRSFWISGVLGYGSICISYLVLALIFGLLGMYLRKRFLLQLLLQIGVDLSVISKLYILAGGAKSGLAILYLLPLAGSAILAPLIVALFFAAVVALFLLLESAYQIFVQLEPNVPIWQAGLYGAAFFTMVVVVNRLALRLINQEALALERGHDLLVQQAINHLVIADVGDGILVLGPDSTVFTANPAAQVMLGLAAREAVAGIKLQEVHSLLPVADAFFAWLHQLGLSATGDGAYFVTIKLREDGPPSMTANTHAVWSGRRESTMHLKLRFVEVEAVALAQRRCVVFIQDVSEIENQAQQLKLASMGRLTASIAHEVRNPLAAIGHAAALLAEDLSGKTQVRLLRIIADNVTRVNRMIEDILQLSRKVPAKIEPIDLQAFLAEIVAEFQETHALAEGVLVVGDSVALAVPFDPLHLREVVVNLLTNAVRYASGQPGSICLIPVGDGSHHSELHVQDDGPGMSLEVRAHLFEPFYTTSSKGTGLGLYLAREMCLNNKATLDYEYRIDPDAGTGRAQGRFVISFALPDQSTV